MNALTQAALEHALRTGDAEIERCRHFHFRQSPLDLPVAPRILGAGRRR